MNFIDEVHKELESTKVNMNLEQRRNTYPLYPMPIKPGVAWPQYKMKAGYPMDNRPSVNYYSEPVLKAEHILRNQLAATRYVAGPGPFLRQVYGFDRGKLAEYYQQKTYILKIMLSRNPPWTLLK